MRAFNVYWRNFMLGMVAARTDQEAAKLAMEKHQKKNLRLERANMWAYRCWAKNQIGGPAK